MSSRTGNAILNETRVRHIKKLLAQGISVREIAEAEDIGTESIRRIRRGDAWKWVEARDVGLTIEQQMDRELETDINREPERKLEYDEMVKGMMERLAKEQTTKDELPIPESVRQKARELLGTREGAEPQETQNERPSNETG